MEQGTKYIVLGSQGQLGQELLKRLPAERTQGLARQQADIGIAGQVSEHLKNMGPETVINCAAYNLVDQAEVNPEAAFAVNALGVRELAQVCARNQATLIHFSTDYVFGLDTARRRPYVESDLPGPISAYGASKVAGEYLVRSMCSKHFVVRTCGLYSRNGTGGKGTNFIETVLRLAQGNKTIRVVDDQVLTPTSAGDLAHVVMQLMVNCPFGLYHLTNAGQCSWHEFAQAIFEMSGTKADLHPVSSAEYGVKAPRPSYSVLASEQTGAPRLRHWRDALGDYLVNRDR